MTSNHRVAFIALWQWGHSMWESGHKIFHNL